MEFEPKISGVESDSSTNWATTTTTTAVQLQLPKYKPLIKLLLFFCSTEVATCERRSPDRDVVVLDADDVRPDLLGKKLGQEAAFDVASHLEC